MALMKKLGRLFVIKSRTEAWMVIYAIAVGSIERGQHYLHTYHGFGGYLLALACTGVVFVAGAKLLDSTPKKAAAGAPARRITDNRPTARRVRFDSGSRLSPDTGSRRSTPPFARPAGSRAYQRRNPRS